MRGLLVWLGAFVALSGEALAAGDGFFGSGGGSAIAGETAGVVSVLDKGALCNGSTDDTAAFEAAMSAGKIVFVPPSVNGCAVCNAEFTDNVVIQGTAGPIYDVNPVGPWSHVVPTAGCSGGLWSADGHRGVTFYNMDTTGSATSTDYASNLKCIGSGSSSQFQFFNSSFRFCGNGGYGDDSNYPNSPRSINTNWVANGQRVGGNGSGIWNWVDGQICGGSITANYNGLYFGPGANNNSICDTTRIEFNEKFGVRCYGAAKNHFGGDYDRNKEGAIGFQYCGRSTGKSGGGTFDSTGVEAGIKVTGRFTRNGSADTVGKQAQFEFFGNNTNVTFSGIDTSHECGDGGCGSNGPDSPKYVAEFADGTDSGIRFTGGNLTGFTTGFDHYVSGSGPSDYEVGGVGVEHKKTGLVGITGAVRVGQIEALGTPTVTNGGASGSTTWSYKVSACGDLACTVQGVGSAAGSNTSGPATLTSTNYNKVAFTKVKGAMAYQIWRTVAGTSPNTTGLVATIAAQQNLDTIKDVHGTGAGGVWWDTGVAGTGGTVPTVDGSGGGKFAGLLEADGGVKLDGKAVPLVMPGGRLTTVSGQPVPQSNTTAATTLYYTRYRGDVVPVYDGTKWVHLTMSEVSLALDSNAGHTGYQQSGKNFDVVARNNAGTLQLCTGPAWTSDSARASGLTMVEGIYVNSGTWTLRCDTSVGTSSCAGGMCTYLGTIRATADGQTAQNMLPAAAAGGGNAIMGVYNAYNQVPLTVRSSDSTTPAADTTVAVHALNASNNNRVSWIDGLGEWAVEVEVEGNVSSDNYCWMGVGLDSTTAKTGSAAFGGWGVWGYSLQKASGHMLPAGGWHYGQIVVSGNTTCLFGKGGEEAAVIYARLNQ